MSDQDRTFSKISIIGSIGLLLLAPLHAVAYLRDEDFEEGGAIDWARSAFDAMPALWNWGDSQDVYLWYGRATSVLLALMLLGVVSLHRRQRWQELRFERWTFRAFALGASLLSVGALLEYYTPFTDDIFLLVALPGLALTLVTGTIFGIATSRAGTLAPPLGLLLAVAFLPGAPLLVALLGHIPIGMSLNAVAWILIGRRLLTPARLRVG